MDNKEQKIHEKAFIYYLKSYKTNDIYIGSTVCNLNKRIYNHKRDYKRYLNGVFRYMSSYELIKHNDCYIEMIETLHNISKKEMHKIEGQYIQNTKCVNNRIAGRSLKEYYKENKEQIKKRNKKYYKENAEKIRAYKNQKHTCICGGKYTTSRKSKHEKTKIHLNYIQKQNN